MPNNILTRSQLTSETILWKNRMETIGADFEWNSLAIANNFARVVKSKSYFSKIVYFLPLLGKGINACLVPLIDKLGRGNSTNIGSLTSGAFNQTSGIVGNGSSQAIQIPIKPSELGSSGNGGLGFLLLNIGATGTQRCIGIQSAFGGGRIYGMDFGDANARFWWGDGASPAATGAGASLGHYYGQRIGSTDRKLYLNATQIATSTTSTDVNGQADENINVLGWTAGGWTVNRAGFAYVTDGTLTVSEIQDLNQMLHEFIIGPTGR